MKKLLLVCILIALGYFYKSYNSIVLFAILIGVGILTYLDKGTVNLFRYLKMFEIRLSKKHIPEICASFVAVLYHFSNVGTFNIFQIIFYTFILGTFLFYSFFISI